MLLIEKINPDANNCDAPELFRSGVDLTVLDAYENLQVGGEPDLIVELVDLYLEDAPVRVAIMREAQAKGNWISVKQQAHGLRGSSGSTGALQMALICGDLEAATSGDVCPDLEDLLSHLELELKRTSQILIAERQRRLQ
jgi:HPt (histidine-containing phosphotransfer) domain-containing protein